LRVAGECTRSGEVCALLHRLDAAADLACSQVSSAKSLLLALTTSVHTASQCTAVVSV
jgi:hypothetical protein